MEPIVIDLGAYLKDNSTVLVGREFGLEVNAKSGLDQKIASGSLVDVIVPAKINSITPSFIQGFLGNSFGKLQINGVRKYIHFKSQGSYNVEEDVTEALNRLQRFTYRPA